jgi:hypothetical protein
MKHSLSFCDVFQISENVFEAVAKEGVIIDKKCSEEAWNFWDTLRNEPFGLLVNHETSFSHSFEGSRDIGRHPLQNKTALLTYNNKQEQEFKMALKIIKITGRHSPHKIFNDREKAIEWLNDLE